MKLRLAVCLVTSAACGSPVSGFATGSIAITITDDGSSDDLSVQANLKAATGCPSLEDTTATCNAAMTTLARAGGAGTGTACDQPELEFTVPKDDDADIEIGDSREGRIIVTHGVYPRSLTVDMDTLTAAPGDTVSVSVNTAPNDMLSLTAALVQDNTVVENLPTTLRLGGTDLDVMIPSDAPMGTYGFSLTANGPLSVAVCTGFATCTATVQLLARYPITISQ